MSNQSPLCFKIIEDVSGFYIRMLTSPVNRGQLEADLDRLGFRLSARLFSQLLNEAPGTPIAIDPDYELDSGFLVYIRNNAEKVVPLEIDITRDQMKAFVRINPDYVHKLDINDVMQELDKMGVKFGINEEAIKESISNPGSKVLVAQGRPPNPGRDAIIKYNYKEPDTKPVMTEDGRVDYYQLGFISAIRAGEAVGERIPATPGEPGMNIMGEEIPAKPGKHADFKTGKGVLVIDDQAVAEYDGALSWLNNRIYVTKMLVIKGDVDFSVGNLNFMGKIMIGGNVKEGFRVEADDDIEIRGMIDNAQVTSRRGSVFIHKGVIGRGNAVITAGKNIEARFAQNIVAEAGQNIIVNEYVLRCDLKAGDSVLIHGRKGRILGNNSIYARTRIKASRVQNCLALDLKVEGIDRRDFYQRVRDLNDAIAKKETDLQNISDLIRKYRTDLDNRDNIERLQKKLPEFLQLSEEYDTLVVERNYLVSILKNTRGEGMIQIDGGLEPGMNFTIKSEPLKLKEKLRNINMYYDPDEQRVIVLSDTSR
ncbi:FapA family protein [Syntrophomonas palmitatica]|uniref:FapA family protein n=1 Tax=Syntrophomonas palmitatica TaxID=402877 RepID=UPI0006D15CC3|nr:FapA family protein [Syntrophomonas palmitatica]